MGFIPIQFTWILIDEKINIMLIDVYTRHTKFDSFEMSKSTIVSMGRTNANRYDDKVVNV
jgi:hypothetical protein